MIAVVVAHECEVTNYAMWHVPQANKKAVPQANKKALALLLKLACPTPSNTGSARSLYRDLRGE